MTKCALLTVLFLGGGLAVAQVELGGVPPAPQWQAWLVGPAVAFADDQAPPCTVYAFYSRPALATAWSGDACYLGALQRRWRERGLRVVAVVGGPVPGVERWDGCAVAVDADGVAAAEWLGEEPQWRVVVLDRRGQAAFAGLPESGLVDAIERVLGGRDALAAERDASHLRRQLAQAFDDATAEVAPLLEAALAHAPRDGVLSGLLYLTQATKANDAAAADAVLRRATAALAAEARPLAAFADLALRGDGRRAGLGDALLPALRTAAAAAPDDAAVQLALLRALVHVGDAREVGRHAMRTRKLTTTSWADSLDFATILTIDRDAPAHGDLATMAVDRAEALGAPARLVTAARYGIARRCHQDRERQQRLLEDYLRDTELRASINSDCWYLLTELPTMGRYDTFAVGLAERMLEQRDAMDYFEFDTAALAMFAAGRVDEAVKLQEEAIDRGGRGTPEYLERLQRYKAGLLPAPR